MGHSEMLLAVAGLKEVEIQTLRNKLADGDWSDFSPAEREVFGFAYRLTKEPAKITDAEVGRLVKRFGEARTLDLVWHISWCNYMTRVADILQLPLETTNVFAGRAASKKK